MLKKSVYAFQIYRSSSKLCEECGKSFKRKDYLTKHRKEVHQITNEGKLLAPETFMCILCDKTFKRKLALKYHVSLAHGSSSNQADKVYLCDACPYSTVYKGTFNRHLNIHKREKATGIRTFQCQYCDAIFNRISHLNHHRRKAHKKKKCEPTKRKCPHCPFVSNSKMKLEIFKHFEEEHNIALTWERLAFDSIEEFNSWKTEQEARNVSCYIKRVNSENIASYVCHRSGYYKAEGTGKRCLKVTGSSKINAFCPSEIRAYIGKSGSVIVKYLPCHIGHENDIKHIRLTKEEKQFIADQLVETSNHKDVLKSIRNSFSDSELKRVHLITDKDIQNIRRSKHLALNK